MARTAFKLSDKLKLKTSDGQESKEIENIQSYTEKLAQAERLLPQKAIIEEISSLQSNSLRALLRSRNFNPLKHFERAISREPIVVNAPVVDLSATIARHAVLPVQAKKWDPSQLSAIAGLQTQQFAVLIGAAGSGKTTVLLEFLRSIKHKIKTLVYTTKDEEGNDVETYALNIGFVSFTGRAVEQMKNALPEEYHTTIGTIHGSKCLAYYPVFGTLPSDPKVIFKPAFDENRKLPYDYIVIDEAGMVPVELWNKLFAACKPNTRIYMVGDINQLPPPYGRSILGFALTKWPYYALTQIHRQAEDSIIISNAHKILNGKMPEEKKGEWSHIKLDAKLGSIGTQHKVIQLLVGMKQKGIFDPEKHTLIVPYNKGELGQKALNKLLLPHFNPNKEKRTIIKTGISVETYSVGDKVMMLANDKAKNLTNGQIGFITDITLNGQYAGKNSDWSQMHLEASTQIENIGDFELKGQEKEEEKKDSNLNERQASHIIHIKFTNNERIYTFGTAGDYRNITHAYAVTCHKMQGGECDTVVVLMHSANLKLLFREWFYTAVTRARKRVILIYNARGVNLALTTQRLKGNTLDEKLKQFVELSTMMEEMEMEDDYSYPMLPSPRKIDFANPLDEDEK